MPPGTGTRIRQIDDTISPHLRRLVEFAEPTGADVCLDVTCGGGQVTAALGPQVRHVTTVNALPRAGVIGPDGRTPTVLFGSENRRGDPDAKATVRADATALPYRDGTFSLVTSRFSLYQLGDPAQAIQEMLRVCRPGGRVVIADVVRPNLAGPERDRLERLRDPEHRGTPSIAALTDMIVRAGADVRRLDVFTVERPIEPWLAGARDTRAADRIRQALTEEVDGGPLTGARPRVISGELWFTQTWAHIAAEPL